MKIYNLILLTLLFLGCANNNPTNANESKVVYVTLGDMDYVADDSLYGNQVINVNGISQDVMDKGGVLAFIERPEREGKPQRWSQLPQLSLAWDDPVFTYISHGLGFVRLSYQSATSIRSAVCCSEGSRLKLVIF